MRIVITGMGIINSITSNYSQLIDSLKKCTHHINKSDTLKGDFPVAEIKNLQHNAFVFRTLNIADIALKETISNINLPKNTGLCFSSSTIGMPELEDTFTKLAQKQNSIFDYSNALSVGQFAQKLAEKYQLTGAITSFSTACSSSANALGYGFLQIKQGICDAVIVGGADALCRLTYYGFQSLKVMSSEPCIPFDVNRKGMNLGEGAGFIVLESLDNAQRRGAKIYAEVLGIGMSADGYHMSSPDPEGKGAQIAMQKALQQSRLNLDEINMISAHGTGTTANDTTESIAIANVFGEHTPNIYVTAIKSYLGHTLGAAGIIGVVSTICSMENNFIPPIIGLEQPALECTFSMAKEKGVEVSVNNALVNAFAFGGNNTSIVLGKYN